VKVIPVPVRLRGLVPATLSVVLLLASAGCGGDDSSDGASASRLDAVTIKGDPGTAPEVAWKSKMDASKVEAETLVEGDGAALTDGQSALAQIWIGNGFTEAQAYSSYDEGAAQLIAPADSIPAITEALSGAKVGSRVAVTAGSAEAFGQTADAATGNPALGIGNDDTVLVIVDVLSAVADAPSGKESPAPSWMPQITFTDGNPSAFDFTGVPKPAGKFRKATLLEGDGERVRKNMSVVVRYLGQVYGGDKPFDENFTTSPTTFQIGVGKVIAGWDKQVVGSNVGSRIVIEVPPKLGYGTAGNESAGIKGTDTLFFVIDVLAAG
jgi:peptidylprolyl isomerase